MVWMRFFFLVYLTNFSDHKTSTVLLLGHLLSQMSPTYEYRHLNTGETTKFSENSVSLLILVEFEQGET